MDIDLNNVGHDPIGQSFLKAFVPAKELMTAFFDSVASLTLGDGAKTGVLARDLNVTNDNATQAAQAGHGGRR
jgi:hypothetical protein